MRQLDIFSDGACSGNPGEASIGVVFKEDGKTIKEISKAIGIATNNVAEYNALIEALREAKALNAEVIRMHTDSEWMFKQIRGEYKVKMEKIKPLYEEAMALAKSFKRVEFKWIPREENQEADRLAAGILKSKASQGDRPDVFVIGEESPSSEG
jgi:ribonuclease HI